MPTFGLLAASVLLVGCQVNASDEGRSRCPDVKPGKPVAPGLVGRIGYISDGGGGGACYGVFVMNADGSGARRVTGPPVTVHFFAAWSPDAQLIAFSGDCGPTERWGICLIKADGSDLRPLAHGPDVYAPTWSPDGQHLAFPRKGEGEGQLDIYVINADGTGERRLTAERGQASSPRWSPDGKWIAFTLYDGTRKQIYKVPSGGGSILPLGHGGRINEAPAWSHDGRRIAFASDRSGKAPSAYMINVRNAPGGDVLPDARAHDIFAMDADGSNVVRLTGDPSANRHPSWSLDDRHLAFVSDRDHTYLVYVMAADGTGQVRLSRHAGDSSSPQWIS